MARGKSFDEEVILERIILIFREKGYKSASMDDIGRQVSLTKTSLYNAYGNKSSLFKKALELYIEGSFKKIDDTLVGDASVSVEITELLYDLFVRPNREEIVLGDLLLNSVHELYHHDKDLYKCASDNMGAMKRKLLVYFDSRLSGGYLRQGTDTNALAEYIITIISGLSLSTRIDPAPKRTSLLIKMAIKNIQDCELSIFV